MKDYIIARSLGHIFLRDIAQVNPPMFGDCEVKKDDTVSPATQLLREIYKANPVTGLPEGDLNVWLSDNTSPEVKQFIQQNLLNETSVSADISGLDVDDDTILELTRGANESQVSYASRVFNYLKSVRESRTDEGKNAG